jgi:hypothetical protein
MKPMRRLAFLLWMVLALVMGQQAAVLHDLGHATGQVSHKQDSRPAPAKCADCGLFAEFSGALGVKAPVVPLIHSTPPLVAALAPQPIALPARVAFRSRAPPASS